MCELSTSSTLLAERKKCPVSEGLSYGSAVVASQARVSEFGDTLEENQFRSELMEIMIIAAPDMSDETSPGR